MKKLLKADMIKAFPAATTVEYAKADFEQLILAVQVNATWAAQPTATIVIKNDAAETLKTVVLDMAADLHAQFQFNLEATDEKFSVTFPAYVGVIAILADKRDIDVADVEDLPVPAIVNPTIVL